MSYKPYFFSHRTVFFSHNKSANSTFSHGFSAKRTGLHIGVEAFFTHSHCHDKTIALQYVPSNCKWQIFPLKAQTGE
jgi:hypothetical protein